MALWMGTERFAPAVNVSENDEAYKVSVELAGLSKDDVDVSVQEGRLTITGEKKEETKDEDENYIRTERSYGSFSRSIPLPSHVDEDAVSAKFKDGVLTVELPKTGEARGRRIEITGGEE
jgi:HSP20 family protein